MLYFVSVIQQSQKTTTGFNESQLRLKFPNPSSAFCLLLLFKCVQIFANYLRGSKVQASLERPRQDECAQKQSSPTARRNNKSVPGDNKRCFQKETQLPE